MFVMSCRSARRISWAVLSALVWGACADGGTLGKGTPPESPRSEESEPSDVPSSGGLGPFLDPGQLEDDGIGCLERPPPNSGVAVGGMSGTSGDLGAAGAANGPEGLAGAGAGVCGCTGERYPKEEAAFQAGERIDRYAYCLVPQDEFGCGPQRCKLGTEACGAVVSHANCCEPQGWTCIPVDQECLASMDDPDEVPCDCFGYPGERCEGIRLGAHWALYKTRWWGR